MKARLLLVDDEARFLEATRDLLAGRGYECTAVADANAAIEALRERRFDIVITDLQMEGNRNLEFVRFLAERVPRPLVILLTAYPTLESAIEAVELPVFAYLVKPVPIDELVERIEHGLGALWGGAPGLESSMLDQLSHREREVVQLLLDGYRVANIAKHLFISPFTVRNHLKSVFSKLGVASQAELLEKLKPPAFER